MGVGGGGGGGTRSDRKNLVLEFWEAQNLNSQVFLSLPCGSSGGGGAPAVTERTWFWRFGRLKISILRVPMWAGGGIRSDRKGGGGDPQ